MGDMDTDRAAQTVVSLLAPGVPEGDVGDGLRSAAERYDKAVLALEANEALAILCNVARDGVAPDDMDQWQSLVGALLG